MMDKLEKTSRMQNDGNKEIKMIPIVCTWCDKIFKISKWEIQNDKRTGVSHGMCPECHEKHEKEFLEKFIEANKDKFIK